MKKNTLILLPIAVLLIFKKIIIMKIHIYTQEYFKTVLCYQYQVKIYIFRPYCLCY